MIAAQVSEEKLQHAAVKYLWHFPRIVDDFRPSFFKGRCFTSSLTGHKALEYSSHLQNPRSSGLGTMLSMWPWKRKYLKEPSYSQTMANQLCSETKGHLIMLCLMQTYPPHTWTFIVNIPHNLLGYQALWLKISRKCYQLVPVTLLSRFGFIIEVVLIN